MIQQIHEKNRKRIDNINDNTTKEKRREEWNKRKETTLTYKKSNGKKPTKHKQSNDQNI